MAKSRLQEWREEHRRKAIRKWIILTVSTVLLIFILLHRWYVTIYDEHWADRNLAVQEAREAAQLVEITSAQPFNADEPWFVVQGTDDSGMEKIVWISDDELTVRDAVYGINEEDARRIVLASGEPVEIIRITPGVWMNQLCYEVYYKIHGVDGPIYYYDYIRFDDGERIETLRLGR